MTNTTNIKISLSSVGWKDRFPGAKVYINDQLIFDEIIANAEQIEWTGELVDGEYKIIVEMYNKHEGDTVLDNNNSIVNDVVLNIDKIIIDEVDLGSLLWSASVYYPSDDNSPEFLTDCVNLGWNGSWKLSFSSPTYLWLLENL
jgi:hypothetical protein